MVIDSQEYEIIVKDVTESEVTLDVAGITATMNAGDTKQFDLDTDSVNELEINLNLIYHGKADLIFKRVSVQAAPQGEERTEEQTQERESERVTVEEGKIAGVAKIVGIILVIVILIAVGISMVLKRRGGGGGGQIRFKPRDLGMSGDKSSEEFYSQSAGPSSSNQPPAF